MRESLRRGFEGLEKYQMMFVAVKGDVVKRLTTLRKVEGCIQEAMTSYV